MCLVIDDMNKVMKGNAKDLKYLQFYFEEYVRGIFKCKCRQSKLITLNAKV